MRFKLKIFYEANMYRDNPSASSGFTMASIETVSLTAFTESIPSSVARPAAKFIIPAVAAVGDITGEGMGYPESN